MCTFAVPAGIVHTPFAVPAGIVTTTCEGAPAASAIVSWVVGAGAGLVGVGDTGGTGVGGTVLVEVGTTVNLSTRRLRSHVLVRLSFEYEIVTLWLPVARFAPTL